MGNVIAEAIGPLKTMEFKDMSLDNRPASMCIACGGETAKEYLQGPDRFYARRTVYRLMRCSGCGLGWLANPPRPEDMGDHYDSLYDAFIHRASDTGREERWSGAVETIRKYKERGALLDLGCGSGSFLKAFMGEGWTLYGVEMSQKASIEARQNTGAEVICGDVLEASFAEDSFDVITCFHVFEHMYKPREVMARILTWLKPGGIFYLHVPNLDAAEAHVFRSYWYALELPRHLYHFSPKSLRTLGRQCGYDEVEQVTQKVPFIEYSLRYILDDVLLRVGASRRSLASAGPPSFIWRVFRKACRLSILPLVNACISLGGDGEILEAVFRKPL